MKFRAFRRKKDNLYYFQFLSEENQVRLNSPSYTDKDLCFNGIREVINSAANAPNYENRTDKDGNHFFILKTAKGQEIGRSIRYKSKKEIEAALAQFMTEAPKAATRENEETESTETETKTAETTSTGNYTKGRIYLKQNQPYLCNNISYDTFQSEGNQKYYFVFKDQEDNAVLVNGDVRGFETIEELENGIKAVMVFAPKKKNYDKRVAKNGKHYFLLQNDEGKSIAKSSSFYNQKKEMDAAVRLVQCAGAEMTAPSPQLLADNYLPIAAYAGAAGFHTFQDEASGQFYFAFNNADGKTFLRSEGYQTEKSRDNGIQSVIKNGPIEKSWNTFFENNRHFYNLKAGNNQEIARSDYYKNEGDMLEDYNLVKGENSPIGVGSAVVGGALVSALMIKQRKDEAKKEKEEAKRLKDEEKQKEAERLKAEEKRKAEDAQLTALALANLNTEKEANQKAAAQKLKAEQEAKLAAEAEAAAKLAAEGERRKKAAAEAATAGMVLAANQKNAMTSSSTSSNNSSGGGLPGWLLPLIIGLVLITLALFYFKGCEGCGKPVTPVKDPVTVDTIVQDTTPFGKGGNELGFIPGSMEFMMADHLKAFDSTFPRTFTAENIAFAKNDIGLDTKAKKQLDNLSVLLKEYPNAEIEINGFIAKGEKTFYKGNKEVSLDDARAREVFNYLKQNGIQATRMEFFGTGLDDNAGIKIKLISRGARK